MQISRDPISDFVISPSIKDSLLANEHINISKKPRNETVMGEGIITGIWIILLSWLHGFSIMVQGMRKARYYL